MGPISNGNLLEALCDLTCQCQEVNSLNGSRTKEALHHDVRVTIEGGLLDTIVKEELASPKETRKLTHIVCGLGYVLIVLPDDNLFVVVRNIGANDPKPTFKENTRIVRVRAVPSVPATSIKADNKAFGRRCPVDPMQKTGICRLWGFERIAFG